MEGKHVMSRRFFCVRSRVGRNEIGKAGKRGQNVKGINQEHTHEQDESFEDRRPSSDR